MTKFLGIDESNLTVSKDLFLEFNQIFDWSFEVHHVLTVGENVQQFNIRINQGPQHGSCLIEPLNGTIETLFTIICFDWIDSDRIKDYSFYCLYFKILVSPFVFIHFLLVHSI